MILNDLKSPWKQLKLNNSLDAMNHEEILQIIVTTEEVTSRHARNLLSNLAMFLFLIVCCQGG